MANFLPHLFLLLTIFPIVFFSPPSSLPTIVTDRQLHNITEPFTGSVDFRKLEGNLSASDTTTFPITATIFIPNDASVSSINLNASDILYHILPQQLTFKKLLNLSIGSRLPTLLLNKSILVTNNSRLNFTIDDTLIVRPNLFMTGVVVIHGIKSALNYSVYGDESLDLETNPNPIPSSSLPVSENQLNGSTSGENQTGGGSSPNLDTNQNSVLGPAPSPSSSLPVSENQMNGSTSGGNQTGGGRSPSDSVPSIIKFQPAHAVLVLITVLAFGWNNLSIYQICALLYLIWNLLLFYVERDEILGN